MYRQMIEMNIKLRSFLSLSIRVVTFSSELWSVIQLGYHHQKNNTLAMLKVWTHTISYLFVYITYKTIRNLEREYEYSESKGKQRKEIEVDGNETKWWCHETQGLQ